MSVEGVRPQLRERIHFAEDRSLAVLSGEDSGIVTLVTGVSGEKPAISLVEPSNVDRVDSRLVESQKRLPEVLQGEDVPVVSVDADELHKTAFANVFQSELLDGRLYLFSDAIVASEGARVHFANHTRNGGMMVSFEHVNPDGKGQRAEVLISAEEIAHLQAGEKRFLREVQEVKTAWILEWANHVAAGDFSGDVEEYHAVGETKDMNAPIGEFEVGDGVILDLNDDRLLPHLREKLLGWVENTLHGSPESADVRAEYVSEDGTSRYKIFSEPLGTKENPWYLCEWVNEGEQPQYILWSQPMYDLNEEFGYSKVE